MSEHLLDVQNLRVSFDTYAGEVQAVRGLSFYIDKGETLAIVGESGCGKSVSIQTVMGLLPMPPARIKEGHIYYEGKDLTTLTDKQMENYRGKEFSMIFQDSMTSLNPTMRVGRQMVEAILVHQKISREEARAVSYTHLVAFSSPQIRFSVVLFPQPDGPRSPTNLPSGISRVRSLTAVISPRVFLLRSGNRFVRFRSSIFIMISSNTESRL